MDVKYEYQPSVDYWQRIESQCPAWQPPNDLIEVEWKKGAALTREDGNSKTRSLVINVPGRGLVEWVMPYQAYVPAIDPAGNICPLTTVTCRNPEDDGTGFADKIRSIKKRSGWFIATREEEFAGLQDQEYAAFLCALSDQRKAAHAQREKEYAATQMSGAERAVREQAQQLTAAVQQGADANREAMIDVAKAIAAEVAKATAKASGK